MRLATPFGWPLDYSSLFTEPLERLEPKKSSGKAVVIAVLGLGGGAASPKNGVRFPDQGLPSPSSRHAAEKSAVFAQTRQCRRLQRPARLTSFSKKATFSGVSVSGVGRFSG
jgi:hypothetical protein